MRSRLILLAVATGLLAVSSATVRTDEAHALTVAPWAPTTTPAYRDPALSEKFWRIVSGQWRARPVSSQSLGVFKAPADFLTKETGWSRPAFARAVALTGELADVAPAAAAGGLAAGPAAVAVGTIAIGTGATFYVTYKLREVYLHILAEIEPPPPPPDATVGWSNLMPFVAGADQHYVHGITTPDFYYSPKATDPADCTANFWNFVGDYVNGWDSAAPCMLFGGSTLYESELRNTAAWEAIQDADFGELETTTFADMYGRIYHLAGRVMPAGSLVSGGYETEVMIEAVDAPGSGSPAFTGSPSKRGPTLTVAPEDDTAPVPSETALDVVRDYLDDHPYIANEISWALDPDHNVRPTPGNPGGPADGSPDDTGAENPATGTDAGSWIMPDCIGEAAEVCVDLVGAVIPNVSPTYIVTSAPEFDPDFEEGAVIETFPAPSTETTQTEVQIEVNPAAPRIDLLEPLWGETYTEYVERLQAEGHVGTITRVDLTEQTGNPQLGPEAPSTITAPTTTTTPIPVYEVGVPFPLPLPTMPINAPVVVHVNPPTFQPRPTHPAQEEGGPRPVASEPLPPPPINFDPITSIDFGCKFPYGFVCYALEVTGWFNVSPIAPKFKFENVTINTPMGDYNIGTWETDLEVMDDYMELLRDLMSVVLWIGTVYLVATRLLGFKAAGDPGEAVDEGLDWR